MRPERRPSGRNGSGRRKSPRKPSCHSGAKAINPRGLGTESPSKRRFHRQVLITSMAKQGKQRRVVRDAQTSDFGAQREPHRTSRILLKVGLALLVVDGVSIVAVVRLSHMNSPGIALLLSGWAAVTFTMTATACLLYSLAFWADKKWHIFSRWVWPRRRA